MQLNVLADETSHKSRTSHIHMCTVTLKVWKLQQKMLLTASRGTSLSATSCGSDIFLIIVQFNLVTSTEVLHNTQLQRRAALQVLPSLKFKHASPIFYFLLNGAVNEGLQSE